MSEYYEPWIPVLGIFAVPAGIAMYLLIHHIRTRVHEQQQFAEYVDTMPGFDTTKHD